MLNKFVYDYPPFLAQYNLAVCVCVFWKCMQSSPSIQYVYELLPLYPKWCQVFYGQYPPLHILHKILNNSCNFFHEIVLMTKLLLIKLLFTKLLLIQLLCTKLLYSKYCTSTSAYENLYLSLTHLLILLL